MDLTNLSSNWKKLQVQMKQDVPKSKSEAESKKRKREISTFTSDSVSRKRIKRRSKMTSDHKQSISIEGADKSNQIELQNTDADLPRRLHSNSINAGLSPDVEIGRYVALDCEMVGVGPHPDRESALARVSMVNFDGDQIYDSFVKPLERVTDWRTHVSGIEPKHMAQARTLQQVQQDVSKVLQDCILVGHSLRHDFHALLLSHPKKDIRDTARHPPYRKLAGGGTPKLSLLASELLGLSIQVGEHCSIEDARACMLLFRRDKSVFEREHAKKFPASRKPQSTVAETDSQARKPKKKKKKRK